VEMRQRFDRSEHLKLPKIDFYQLKINFSQENLETEPHTKDKLHAITSIELRPIEREDRDLKSGQNITRTFLDQEVGEKANFEYWLLQIVKESFGGITLDNLRPYFDVIYSVFQRITFYHRKDLLVFNERYPLGAINASIRKAFYCRRELRFSEEIIHKEVDLLVVKNLKPIPVSDLLVPNDKEIINITTADRLNQTVVQIIESQNIAMEPARQNMIDIGMGYMADQLTIPPPTDWENNKDHTFHFLPYRFDSKLEKTFLAQVLQDADFQQLGLEIYFNGEDNLTDFSIDCYKKLTQERWRKIGKYYPDFLMLQRDKPGGTLHKILIIETKGEGFALNFQDKKTFMETEFLVRNNKEFGYQRFDFLYLQDDDPKMTYQLNTRIKAFFKK
jgi:type III restriction enzyme